jgi:hypothetical protein
MNEFCKYVQSACSFFLRMLSQKISRQRQATDPLPPGTFTSHQHSEEWLIKNALSAGPDWITDKATVTVMAMHAETSGGDHMIERVLRQGSNGWTCMPDTPGRPQHDPMCPPLIVLAQGLL